MKRLGLAISFLGMMAPVNAWVHCEHRWALGTFHDISQDADRFFRCGRGHITLLKAPLDVSPSLLSTYKSRWGGYVFLRGSDFSRREKRNTNEWLFVLGKASREFTEEDTSFRGGESWYRSDGREHVAEMMPPYVCAMWASNISVDLKDRSPVFRWLSPVGVISMLYNEHRGTHEEREIPWVGPHGGAWSAGELCSRISTIPLRDCETVTYTAETSLARDPFLAVVLPRSSPTSAAHPYSARTLNLDALEIELARGNTGLEKPIYKEPVKYLDRLLVWNVNQRLGDNVLLPHRVITQGQMIAQRKWISNLSTFLRKKPRVVFYTGEGISKTIVPTLPQIMRVLGMREPYSFSQLVKVLDWASRDTKYLAKLFEALFVQPCLSRETTLGHYVITELSRHFDSAVMTENADLLHQVAGLDVITPEFINKRRIRLSELKKIDAVITVGLPRDSSGFIGWYKKENPRGIVIALNNVATEYLDKQDWFIQGDVQQLLYDLADEFHLTSRSPSLARKMSEHAGNQMSRFGGYCSFIAGSVFHQLKTLAGVGKNRPGTTPLQRKNQVSWTPNIDVPRDIKIRLW
jgi:NAD-dependent SIR2 family protein deacetylase